VSIAPRRGEIWLADLNPTRGHEQAGSRPILVISNDTFNRGPAGLVLALPLTRTQRNIPLHVAVDPPEGGLTSRSYIICDSIRSFSKDRLGSSPWGMLSLNTMLQVENILRVLMKL
jgi:mRNA interferase MazF